MSEKLVVHSGGKLTRKTINNGLLSYVGSAYTSIAASAPGSYVIAYNGSSYSLVQEEAAAAGITQIDSSFFKTSNGNSITINGNTIPYFKDNQTFSTISLPNSNGYYLCYYNGSNYSYTVINPNTLFTNIFQLPSDTNAIIAYNASDNNIQGLDLPDEDGNYVLKKNGNVYTWINRTTSAIGDDESTPKQAFCISMDVNSDTELVSESINITSDHYGIFTNNTPSSIPSVKTGKQYRFTFHLNCYLQDAIETENVHYPITLSGTDVVSVEQYIGDEATNSLRLVFDSILTPSNNYVSFKIVIPSNIRLKLRRKIPCYLICQEV